jgi:hypothetical protein
MKFHTQIRTLVTASLLALTIISLPAAQADASAISMIGQAACEAEGGQWDDELGCGTKSCRVVGGSFWVRPGTAYMDAKGHIYVCNGHTGQFQARTTSVPENLPSLQATGIAPATSHP